MKVTHELKVFPKYYQETFEGNKPFEIRKNDRDFEEGHNVILRECDETRMFKEMNAFTGRRLKARISYVLYNFEGLQPGYVVFGLKEIRELFDKID